MSKQNTRATIDANIKQNGQQQITGAILNSVLNTMVTDYAEQEKLTDLERKVEMPTPLVLDSSSWRIGQTIDSVGGYVDGVTWARHVVFHPIPSGISGLRITGTPTSYWIHQYDENQTWIKRVSATESLVMLADIDSRCRFIRFVAGNPSSSGIAMTQEKANSVSVSWIYDITMVNEELRTIDSEMGDIKDAIGLPYLVEKNKEFAHNAVYTTREPKGGEKIAVRVTTDVPRLFGVIAYIGGQYVTLGTFLDNGWHTYDYPSGSFSLNIQNQSGYTTSADIEVAGYGLVQKVDKITSYDFSSYGEENKDYVTMCLDAVLADISNKHIKLPSWYSEQMTINLIGQRNFVLDGNGATILPINGFVFNRCNDFTIKNCKIDFRNAGSRLECVKVTGNSSDVCITDNIITGSVRDDGTFHGGGIMVMPSESGEISNIRISNNRILDSHLNGILVQCNCSDFHIHNNVVIGGDNIGIEIEGRTGDAFSTVEHRCHSGYISNNIVRNMKDWGVLVNFTDNCNVHDNIVEDCYSAALILGSRNINFHHNRFENIANKGIEVSPELYYPSRLGGSIQGDNSYTTNENIIIDSNIVKANPRDEYVRIPSGVIMINYARKVICSNNQIEAIDVNNTTTHSNGISISSSQEVSVTGNQIFCRNLLRYGIAIANAFMYSCIRYKDASGVTQEKRDYLNPDTNYNLRDVNISDNVIVGEKGNDNTVGIGHFLTDAPDVLRDAFTTFSEVTIKENKISGFFYSLYLPKDSNDGSLVSLRNNEVVNCTAVQVSKTKETATPNINTVPVGTSYFDAALNKVFYKSSLNTWVDQSGNIKP